MTTPRQVSELQYVSKNNILGLLDFSVVDEDYVSGPHTVEFNTLGISLPTSLCTTIATIDDSNVEGPHTFTVEIMDVTLPSSVSIESPSQQSALIIDNDGM